jgi:signal transduction histidine kinase
MHRGTRGSIESAFPGGVLKKTADGVRVGIHNSKRRKSETADLTLAGRLLVAQEVERAHIARELHDDIGQSIAIVSMQLDRFGLLLNGASKEADDQLNDVCKKMRLLGQRVHTLSHQFHSSQLEVLGLAKSAKSLCREFSEQFGVQVNYRFSRISQDLSTDIAVSLFRVLQEALRNVTKHSCAKKVEVELYETGGRLCLKCSDDGEGFDYDSRFDSPGLGLISMRERMCLLGGSFEIWSKRGFGTRIEARVPLSRPQPPRMPSVQR